MTGAKELCLVNGAGLKKNDWLQMGDGAEAEYRQLAADPVPAERVALRLPLALHHGSGVTVEHHAAMGAPGADTPELVAEVKPGDTEIKIKGEGAIVPGALLRLGNVADGSDEYLFAEKEDPTAPDERMVTLRTPARLAHPGGAGNVVQLLPAPGAATGTTTLSAEAGENDSSLLVQDSAPFTAGGFLMVSDGDHSELRRIGQFGSLSLPLPCYADYPAATTVDVVTLTDNDTAPAPGRKLKATAAAGSNVLDLDNRKDLQKGDLIRIGLASADEVEYLSIVEIQNRMSGDDPGKVVLSASLQEEHGQDTPVCIQKVTLPLAAPSRLAVPAARNSALLVFSDVTGITAPATVRVLVPPDQSYYHRLDSAPASGFLSPGQVSFGIALSLPHAAGTPVAAREPLLLVRALDAGAWGNRLRVSVQAPKSPLVDTRIQAIADSSHIKLDSPNGIEIGTVLQRRKASGQPVDVPTKVTGVDRQNGYLLTVDPPWPGAVVGEALRSCEFQLNVYLLRQPDPAVPSRDEQLLDAESFPNLSLDPRHSRYLHKVIGTTWSPGLPSDDDGLPLRLSDRRSEGESRYVRIQDRNPGYAIRLGPEFLTDALPDGRVRPTRIPLRGGDDAVGALSDRNFIGVDDPDPENRTGLHSLRNIEEISIVACPGHTGTEIQNALINHCELMRYRFAVLDGPKPPNDTLADVQKMRQQFDTKYAAFYHPWLLIPEPFPVNLARVADYPIPPSGHILGVYARTDIERGVHKAPANEVVRGVLGLQRILNKEQHDILNPYPVNINVIRDFRSNNRGIRVYGGRCITSDSDWKYVNARRLLIFIESSLDRGLQWVVFEPNAEPLWARVRRSIANFLTLLWRNGALEGTKPEEAFFVKCDRTTMTQTDIDSGRLICVIGVAPGKPAEFVIVRIGLWTAHAED